MSDTPTDDPTDPYLWLEDVEGDRALDWVRERNAETERDLEGAAGFAETEAAIREVLDSDDRIPLIGRAGDWYYNVWRDADHERGVWRRTTLESYRTDAPEWDVLLDVDALAASEDVPWVWHGAAVLRTGDHAYRRALVTLSRGGSDADTTRELDLDTRTFVAEDDGGFVRPEGKGTAIWVDLDTLLVATDTGPESLTRSGYSRQVRRWRRGTPLAEAPLVHETTPDDMAAGVSYDRTPGHERTYVHRMISFYTSQTFLVGEDDALTHLQVPDSAMVSVWRDTLLVELRDAWTPAEAGPTHPPGALLAIDLDEFLAGGRDLASVFVPTDTEALVGWTTTRHRLVLTVLDDVQHRIDVLTPGDGGWQRHGLPGLDDHLAISIAPVDAVESDDVWVQVTGFLTPSTLAICDLGDGVEAGGEPGAPELLKSGPAYFDTDGLAVTQRFATSDDGTRVPYFVVAPTDVELDGSTPTLLYGYGGFEISLTPSYSGTTGRAWLEHGRAFVVANIRGGGEYGPQWHQAALRENRHRAYDDFAAVARDLADWGLTTSERLGIMGGSNGGLLVGNALVRYPELLGAVVCTVPLLDMLRYTRLLAGASWVAEYGDPDDPADRAFVSEISAYHRIDADAAYPPVLLTTSTRDDRVHPGHARKAAARLREQGHEVAYWENVEGGHGGASTNAQAAYKSALEYTFLASRLDRRGQSDNG